MRLIYGEQSGNCLCSRSLEEEEVKLMVKRISGKDSLWNGIAESCDITDKSFASFTSELNKMFTKYGFKTCIDKISFLAQAAHETGGFQQNKEEKSSHASSTSTYKGRGLIQITGDLKDGEYNEAGLYKKYADSVNDQSIISNPDLVSENLHYTIDSSGWYFARIKKVPKWSGTWSSYDNIRKKKVAYFNEGLGKTLLELGPLINQDSKYFWLQSKIINGYSKKHYLEKNPNGWDDRKEKFSLIIGLFKTNTECINNPNKLDFTDKAPWMKIAIEEAYNAAFIKEKKRPVAAMVKKYHNYNNYFDDPNTPNYIEDKEDAWCASFANWVLAQANQKHIKSPASQGVLTAEGTNFIRVTEPSFGAIVLMTNYRKDTGASIGKGHMTFLYGKESNGNLVCLGGNQGDRIKFSPYKQTGVSSSRKVKINGVKVTIEQKFNGFFLPLNYTPSQIDKEIEIINIDNMNSSLSGSTLTNTSDSNESTL